METSRTSSTVHAPTISTTTADSPAFGGVLLRRGQPRPWWEGLDGKIRRGDPVKIPKAALRAFGVEHWDGRQDCTVLPGGLVITSVTNEENHHG